MRRIPLVDLKTQYRALEKEFQRAFRKIFNKMQLIGREEVRLFEKEFASFYGASYGISVASGTEALHLALRALGVRRGEEVITVPFTFMATAEAILQLGAKPVFVDIDPLSYTMDVSTVERKITRKTKAFLPVHLYGHPCDVTPLLYLSKKYGIPIVEDAAQAHGASENGRKVGAIGKVACFSFYPAKNLGAYGEGGMVLTRDGRLAERVRLLRNHGCVTKYEHAIPGFNGRMDELQAAVLRIKLKRLARWNDQRRRRARRYREGLLGLPIGLPQEKSSACHVYHQFVIRTPRRDRLRAFLSGEGIETGIHYPIPLHLQKALRPLGFRKGSFPRSEKAAEEVLSLPVFPELKRTDQDRVIRAIRKFFKAD